jgi:hypothetical protein
MSEEVLLAGTDTNAPGNTATADDATKVADSTGQADDATKVDGDATAKTGDEGTKDGDKPAGAPEKYEFKVPEGMALDAAKAESFSAIAKEAGLNQEAAQKFLDMYVADRKALADNHKAEVAKWGDQVKADKELGGDKLQTSLATANKAIDLGGKELKDLLKSSGLGNHPVIFRWAHSIGKAMAQDTIVRGDTSTGEVDRAKVMFPNMK